MSSIVRRTTTGRRGRGDGFQDFFGSGAGPRSKDAAVVRIQARARGTLARKRVAVLKGGGTADGKRESMPMAQRAPGHPTDRELIGQKAARLRHEEQRKQGKGYAESSFDGASTVDEKFQIPKSKEAKTPAPTDMSYGKMKFSTYDHMRLAFEMCDAQREGMLNRKQAHAFLKAVGWMGTNEELDKVLDGPNNKTGIKLPMDEVWGQKHLIEAMEIAAVQQSNGSVQELTDSLRLLAFGKERISRNRLVEVTVANSTFVNDKLKQHFIACLDKQNFRTMAVDEIAQAVMTKICDPPPALEKYTLKHA